MFSSEKDPEKVQENTTIVPYKEQPLSCMQFKSMKKIGPTWTTKLERHYW